jgi:CSLREA domain-containing protein
VRILSSKVYFALPAKIILLPALILCLVTGSVSLAMSSLMQPSSTFTVNSLDNSNDGSCNAAHCSLIEAIQAANAQADYSAIEFNISGSGPFTITPTTGLPAISAPVIIDGATQPGFAGTPIIELSGSLIGSGAKGLEISGGNSTIRGLIVNRFSYGILLKTNGGNIILGNYIGTDVTGTIASSDGTGIRIESANNVIGGISATDRNLISGNRSTGIQIWGAAAAQNTIQGNYIGVDVTGNTALENGGQGGIQIYLGSNNLIGGTNQGAGNVISGHLTQGLGVSISDSNNNLVQGNYIGTNADGNAALPNMNGIQVVGGASNNTIGGTVSGAGNVISSNSGAGIYFGDIDTAASGNLIQGNMIGTNAAGTSALGNDQGIYITWNATDNTIGGTGTGAANVIAGNNTGILLMGSGVFNTIIQGNFIGTNPQLMTEIGNTMGGIVIIASHNNEIGGTVPNAKNVIAYNGGVGISVTNSPGVSNLLTGNAIFVNAGLGIDLSADGVTANDPGDNDTGRNLLQNFPVLQSASLLNQNLTLVGMLSSGLSQAYTLEFFANDTCDPSGYGEGQFFLGSSTVNTDASGSVSFQISFNAAATVGQFITATATDSSNNTSEFAACIPVVLDVPIPTLLSPSDNLSTTDTQPVFTWEPIPQVTSYEIQLGTSNPPIEISTVADANYTPATPLALGTYYWRVRVQGGSEWSDIWSITIVAPTFTPTDTPTATATPTLITPTSPPNATPGPHFFAVRHPTLTWNRITWALGYQLEIDDDPNFGSPIPVPDEFSVNIQSYTTESELADGIYYWRVRAKRNDIDWGDWSATETIIVSAS